MNATQWHSLELGRRVEADLAADIEKQGAYVSPNITGVKVEGGSIVFYELDATSDPVDARSKMDRYLSRMLAKFRPLPHKVVAVHHRRDDGPLSCGRS